MLMLKITREILLFIWSAGKAPYRVLRLVIVYYNDCISFTMTLLF